MLAKNPAVLRYGELVLRQSRGLQVSSYSCLKCLQQTESVPQAVIVGPEFIECGREIRESFPECYLLGLLDWSRDFSPSLVEAFDSVRDLTTPFGELLDHWLEDWPQAP